MAKHDNRMPIQTALGYVEEARAASRDWRAKSWRDHEMYDGDQWTPEDRQRAVDAGIDPLTINRIFPAINLILGSQELNRANIIAKARTAKDGQIAEIMTEALAFVLDQNDGQYRIGQAFKDAVIPGIGWLYCGFNNDPGADQARLPRLERGVLGPLRLAVAGIGQMPLRLLPALDGPLRPAMPVSRAGKGDWGSVLRPERARFGLLLHGRRGRHRGAGQARPRLDPLVGP